MDKTEIIYKTSDFVKNELINAEAGHDWWHILRVWNLAKHIATKENFANIDLFIVEMGALLHDIADAKFHNGDEEIGPQKAEEFLLSLAVEENTINHIKKIIKHISYKNSFDKHSFTSPELQIIQDADRLDALGAIGIARAFNYGGFKNRELFNPELKPKIYTSKEDYQKNNQSTINHFHEKILLLKDKMNTQTGKNLAIDRHKFVEQFLENFSKEWNLS